MYPHAFLQFHLFVSLSQFFAASLPKNTLHNFDNTIIIIIIILDSKDVQKQRQLRGKRVAIDWKFDSFVQ